MVKDRKIATVLPHSLLGDEDCCGCLNGIDHEDLAVIQYNECGAVVRSAAATELQKALDEMEAVYT